MDPRNHQGLYGEAYVSALAAAAGLRTAKPVPDMDGVDLAVWPDRIGRLGGARYPALCVQVKSDSGPTETETHWGHRMKAEHFNVLADSDAYTLPVMLVLVITPKEWPHYTSATDDGLTLHRGAYWHMMEDETPIASPGKYQKKTVHVPKSQLLTVEMFRKLAEPGTTVEAP